MNNKRLFAAILCLCPLLILSLSAGLLAVSYSDVSIVPRASDGTAAPAAEATYWLQIDLEPGELYQRALRQTVLIYWKSYDEEGNLTGSVSATGIILSHDG